ncbi:cupin domain-containing protein [Flexithrix dorotheae]|uniref:cupin domain-containing protein n=1 Tax=Flexithrix dorotheae TaxID=70993 RepID=UPI00037084A9|nr:cupin domain-containing protein [Flexithrix dorotheae]
MKIYHLLFAITISFSCVGQSTSQKLSGVYQWNQKAVKKSDGQEIKTFIKGPSTHFEMLDLHAVTLGSGGKLTHESNHEDMEEVIIVKEGLLQVTIDGKQNTLGPQGVVQLLPGKDHTFENVGEENLAFYVMQYKSRKPVDMERGVSNGGSWVYNADSLIFKRSIKGGGRAYFDHSTAMCERFEMHVTQLSAKGPSHAPHKHDETEIILMISGKTDILIDGKKYKAKAGDFYFMDSGLMHGVSNIQDEPCTYFAFKWK